MIQKSGHRNISKSAGFSGFACLKQTWHFWKCSGSVGLCIGLFLLIPFLQAASIGEKEPIKETQTTPVPVTDELLNREGEPGPASPSFKFEDSADFFFRDPRLPEEELEEMGEGEPKEPDEFGEDWLFGDQEEEDSENFWQEPITEE